ncbi:flavodoxin [Bacteroides sp. AN502(2024)]|uniref:flavodoxin n=1 Tax=Bacteroides sp. AN502(2024) TaxID=3160599 RepID=UPI003517E356
MKIVLSMLLSLCLTFTTASCDNDEPELSDTTEIENQGENGGENSDDPKTPSEHKTLIAYYSYTNNVERIVTELRSQINADIVEFEPAQKGLDYAANNYALGTQLLNAIKADPNSASSYPAIDNVDVDLAKYDMVIIACPLWWSQMAAPFQAFLFNYSSQMAGKNIGVIVSSASSGINGVVADAKRLIPEGNFIEPNLWIRSSQTFNAASLISTWLNDIHYNDLTSAVASIAAYINYLLL